MWSRFSACGELQCRPDSPYAPICREKQRLLRPLSSHCSTSWQRLVLADNGGALQLASVVKLESMMRGNEPRLCAQLVRSHSGHGCYLRPSKPPLTRPRASSQANQLPSFSLSEVQCANLPSRQEQAVHSHSVVGVYFEDPGVAGPMNGYDRLRGQIFRTTSGSIRPIH